MSAFHTLVQAATAARREELRDRVENLVTKGLQAVFRRTDYEFLFEARLTRDVYAMHPMLRSGFGDKKIDVEITTEKHAVGEVLTIHRPDQDPTTFDFSHVWVGEEARTA